MLSAALGFAVVWGAVVGADPPAEKSPVRIECHGKLRSGVSAIGGETTGTTVDFDGIHFDLTFANQADQTFASNNHKKPVTVLGTVRQVKGPERGIRWVIDVEKISPREAMQKHGAKVTIIGNVMKNEKDGNFVLQTGEVAWPLQRPEDKSLLEKADSLLDKTVTLVGKPVKPADERMTLRPLVRIDGIELFAGKMAKK